MPTPNRTNMTAGYSNGGVGGKTNISGYAGTGIGGPLDIGKMIFGGKDGPDMKGDPSIMNYNQDPQQDRRFAEGQINQAYDGANRQKQYTDYLNALRGMYTDQVNQQEQGAVRNLKFANARTGNTGGSVAADNGGLLQRDYQSGLLTAADAARTGVDDLRSQDQAEKRNLIQLSNEGSNVGANNSGILQSSLLGQQQASRGATVQSLGDMFSNLGNIYQQSQARKYAPVSPFGASAWG